MSKFTVTWVKGKEILTETDTLDSVMAELENISTENLVVQINFKEKKIVIEEIAIEETHSFK